MQKIICFAHGASRGNPGPAAIGVYVTDESGQIVHELGQAIGNSTNTFAAYQAVMVGLETIQQIFGNETTDTHVEICLDSEPVKKQLNAEDPITDPGLVPLFIAIHNVRVSSFPHLTYTYIPEEQNTDAIDLVAKTLDGKQ